MDKDHSALLAAVPRPVGRSAHFCMDCDERIPERRRQAYPGTQRCVSCQEDAERGR
ncbi:MAG: TraR/DksA C4-type zinc finger protein [Dehalococcoidia bacterium]|nr:TraR/DksA C4-type zinc finger protein [Dehalococcoidia bacterium]